MQERRDLAVILGSCFICCLAVAIVVTVAVAGTAAVLDHWGRLLVFAAGGTTAAFCGLVMIALLDAQARHRIAREAERLEEAMWAMRQRREGDQDQQDDRA